MTKRSKYQTRGTISQRRYHLSDQYPKQDESVMKNRRKVRQVGNEFDALEGSRKNRKKDGKADGSPTASPGPTSTPVPTITLAPSPVPSVTTTPTTQDHTESAVNGSPGNNHDSGTDGLESDVTPSPSPDPTQHPTNAPSQYPSLTPTHAPSTSSPSQAPSSSLPSPAPTTPLPSQENAAEEQQARANFVVAVDRSVTDPTSYRADLGTSMDQLALKVAKANFVGMFRVDRPAVLETIQNVDCPALVDTSRDRCEDITVRIGLYFAEDTTSANPALRQKATMEEFKNEELAIDYETQINKAIVEQELQGFLDEVHEEDVVWIVTGATSAPYGVDSSGNGQGNSDNSGNADNNGSNGNNGNNDNNLNSNVENPTIQESNKDDNQLGGGPLAALVAGPLLFLLLLAFFVRRRSNIGKQLRGLDDLSDLDSDDSLAEKPSPDIESEKTASLGNGWVGGKSIDKEDEEPKIDTAEWGPAPDYVPKQLSKEPTATSGEQVDIDEQVWNGVLFADGDGEEDSDYDEDDEVESVGVDSVTRRRRRRQKRLEAEERFLSQQGAVWTAIENDDEHSLARSDHRVDWAIENSLHALVDASRAFDDTSVSTNRSTGSRYSVRTQDSLLL